MAKISPLQMLYHFCFSFVKSLPVFFISGIVGWSYYAYVIALILYAMIDNPIEQVFIFIYFLLLNCTLENIFSFKYGWHKRWVPIGRPSMVIFYVREVIRISLFRNSLYGYQKRFAKIKKIIVILFCKMLLIPFIT